MTPRPPTDERTVEYSDASRLHGNPLVSVIVLSYNHAPFLAQAIESAASQETDFDFEILIGEDCSTDASLQIAFDLQQRYPSLVRIITSDRNVGAYRNYLRLLHAARGRYFAQLDGDDCWLPGKIAKQIRLLRNNPESSAVYTNAYTVHHGNEPTGVFNDLGDVTIDLQLLLRWGNVLNTSTMVYRAEFARHLSSIDHEYIDYQTHLVLAGHGSLLHIGEPLASYRVASQGSMVASSNARVRELYWQAIQSVPRDAVSDDDYAHGLADFLRRVFFRSVATRDPDLLRSWAQRVYAASPRGRVRTTALVAANILRMTGKMMAARVPFFGHEKNVLYRH